MSSSALLLRRSSPTAWRRRSVVASSAPFSTMEGGATKQQKAKKKQKKGGGSGEQSRGRDPALTLMLAALDAPITKPPPAPKEEMERRFQIGRNYVIGKFNRHNELNHDLNCKMRLKSHAIKMLPRNSKLKEAALEIDTVGPPKWRLIPHDTPPIPDFDPEPFLDKTDT